MSARNLSARPLPGKKRRRLPRELRAMAADVNRLIAERERGMPAVPAGRRAVAEVVPLADAARHPIFAPAVVEAIMVSFLVAAHDAPVRHGDLCFTCGGRWRLLEREPRAAVLQTVTGANVGRTGLVCGPCVARGPSAVAEMVKAVLRDMQGMTNVRSGVVTAPGGHA